MTRSHYRQAALKAVIACICAVGAETAMAAERDSGVADTSSTLTLERQPDRIGPLDRFSPLSDKNQTPSGYTMNSLGLPERASISPYSVHNAQSPDTSTGSPFLHPQAYPHTRYDFRGSPGALDVAAGVGAMALSIFARPSPGPCSEGRGTPGTPCYGRAP